MKSNTPVVLHMGGRGGALLEFRTSLGKVCSDVSQGYITTLPQKQKGEAGSRGGFWRRRLMALVLTLPNTVTL